MACPAEGDTYLLESPLKELLLAYDVLQLQLAIPDCLLLRGASGLRGPACAVGCMLSILCGSSAAIAITLLLHSTVKQADEFAAQSRLVVKSLRVI